VGGGARSGNPEAYEREILPRVKEMTVPELEQDSSSRLLETARAPFPWCSLDPGTTNSEKIRAATALARILCPPARSHRRSAPLRSTGCSCPNMPDDPDPDTEYIVITPEIEAGADRVLRETAN
jgi:hypothetical protein